MYKNLGTRWQKQKILILLIKIRNWWMRYSLVHKSYISFNCRSSEKNTFEPIANDNRKFNQTQYTLSSPQYTFWTNSLERQSAVWGYYVNLTTKINSAILMIQGNDGNWIEVNLLIKSVFQLRFELPSLHSLVTDGPFYITHARCLRTHVLM